MNAPAIHHAGTDSARRDDARATSARVSRRSLRTGMIAALAMALFYVAVVRGASGSWTHLWDQARLDWAYLAVIVAGFGTQVALVAELRQRHRLDAAATAAGGVSVGASTAGMVACCAHHLADVIPFIGATGAAAFLTDYRVAFMLVGIGVNAIGVFVAARRLHHEYAHTSRKERSTSREDRCALD